MRELHLEMERQKRRVALKLLDDARTTDVEDALLAAAKSGDVAAMAFWLVNRAPDRWKLDPQAPIERQKWVNAEIGRAPERWKLDPMTMTERDHAE